MILLRPRLFLEQQQQDALPQSKIGKAVGYALDVWQYLADILRRLADLNPGELERLLPDIWRLEQAPATLPQPSNNAA